MGGGGASSVFFVPRIFGATAIMLNKNKKFRKLNRVVEELLTNLR